MLKERDTELCTQTPDRLPSHFFNSFFMERLMISNNGYEYSNIRRWTKKVDVFGLDKVRTYNNYEYYNNRGYISLKKIILCNKHK